MGFQNKVSDQNWFEKRIMTFTYSYHFATISRMAFISILNVNVFRHYLLIQDFEIAFTFEKTEKILFLNLI
jgi:hypothetical protein